MADLNLALVLKADSSGFRGGLREAGGSLRELGDRSEASGRRVQRGFGRRILDVTTGPLQRFGRGLGGVARGIGKFATSLGGIATGGGLAFLVKQSIAGQTNWPSSPTGSTARPTSCRRCAGPPGSRARVRRHSRTECPG